jgi:uncharacterized protein DUF6236
MPMDQRGIVLGSYHKLDLALFTVESVMAGRPEPTGEVSYTPMPGLIEPAIRRSILYFDVIDWPLTRYSLPAGPELAILEKQGILRRTPTALPAAASPDLDWLSGAHRLTFEQHERAEPGVWSFGHLLPGAVWGPEIEPEQLPLEWCRGVDFELYRALPVPTDDVPYPEILDFKWRRGDQLAALRAYLDDLYREVVNSRDMPRAKIAALSKLDGALADVARLLRESGIRAFWGSLSATLLFDVARDIAAGSKIAELTGHTTTFGAEIGAVGALYRFISRVLTSPIKRAGPLAYIARAAKEEIIRIEPPQ